MAECVYCERSGWLLAVDGRGLCNDCARQVGPAIDENISIMQSSYKVAASAKTITMKLSRLEDCRLALENLVPFAEAGIPTLATPPDELAEQIGVIYRSAAGEEVEAIIATAQDKSNAASTDAARLRPYSSAVDKLKKLARDYPDLPIFAEAADKMLLALDTYKFELACRRSEAEEAKGKPKKAADILIDAMIALKYDNTPDADQEELFERARMRIEALGATAPF